MSAIWGDVKINRAAAFDDYFNSIYGERWSVLREALLMEPQQEILRNPFGLQDYRLDKASTLPAKNMSVGSGHHVADFCASPGGKSLAMIFATLGRGVTAAFSCNDLSPGRVQRLKAVFHDCLPPDVLRTIAVTKSDAARWGLRRQGDFDRILVDAPCSGERHLLSKPEELKRWSLKGSKRLVIRQNALLCSAIDCLKPGGRLVYSTCSINPIENDGVIARLKNSRPDLFKVIQVQEEIGEATQDGWIVLPDQARCGPIYFSVLEKI